MHITNYFISQGTANISVETFSGQTIEDEDFSFLTEAWKQRHVKQSQYLMQIVKCANIDCCKPVRTNIRDFLKDQFLPAPIPLVRSTQGLKLGKLEDKNAHFYDLSTRITCEFLLDYPMKCYDKYCPSTQHKLTDPDFTCTVCGDYFVTKVAAKSHKKVHSRTQISNCDEEEDELVSGGIVEDDGIFFIEDMMEWLAPVFVDDESELVP